MVHRSTVTGTRGMVASAHPLATLAGTRMLLAGGNAFDAAVATAAALNVVEPFMSGIAGVGFALIYDAEKKERRLLDYTGRTPMGARPDLFTDPASKERGILSCLVPGACAGWLELLERHGRLTAEAVFAPAIELAEGGFGLSVASDFFFRGAADRLSERGREIVFGETGPFPGKRLVQPELAETFRRVVSGGRETFYRGSLAQEMVGFVQDNGGLLTADDMAAYDIEWRDPLSTTYRDYEIFAPSPPGAGFQILETLNLIENDNVGEMAFQSPEHLHLLIEAIKLANADRLQYVAADQPPIEGLLSKGYAAKRRGLIGEKAAEGMGEWYPAQDIDGGVRPGVEADWLTECTTHFDAVDGDGNAVAITQSLGSAFGSGLVMGNTGMFLNNFMNWSELEPRSANLVGPGRKIDMCLSPCQVWKDDKLFSVMGTPGSHGIMQTTVQFMSNVLDFGMSMQAAIEAPRLRTEHQGRRVMMEGRFPQQVRAKLEGRGHQIDLLPDWSASVGGAQGILVDSESGVMMGGADPRRDGYVIGI